MHAQSIDPETIHKALSRLSISLSAAILLGTAALAHPAGAAHNAADAEQAYPALQMKTECRGPAILMIPGLALSGATWDATAAHGA